MKNHSVITGTGRSGTTFLVELLTHCGLDTGYSLESLRTEKDQIARAGLEHIFIDANSPYIIKDPSFFEYAEKVLQSEKLVLDYVFVSLRNLEAAADSRRLVQSANLSKMSLRQRIHYKLKPFTFPGAIWAGVSGKKGNLEAHLSDNIYQLLLTCSKYHVPVVLLNFPRLVKDVQYAFQKLSPILRGMVFEEFETHFNKVADLSLVHQFNAEDT